MIRLRKYLSHAADYRNPPRLWFLCYLGNHGQRFIRLTFALRHPIAAWRWLTRGVPHWSVPQGPL